MGNEQSSSRAPSRSGSSKSSDLNPDEAVLIPPSFGVGPSDLLPLTLAAHDALQSSFYPVFFRHVEVSDPSYRLLHDHLEPGFYLNSTTSQSSVSASINLNRSFQHSRPTTSETTPTINKDAAASSTQKSTPKKEGTKSKSQNSPSSSSPPSLATATAGGSILGERRITDTITAHIRGGTSASPSLLTHWRVIPGFSIRAAANQEGQGWMSSIFSYSTNDVSLVGATWLPLELTTLSAMSRNYKSFSTSDTSLEAPAVQPGKMNSGLTDDNSVVSSTMQPTFNNMAQALPHLTTFGAIRLANMTGAVESKITTETMNVQNQYYFTLNYAEDDSGPPLQLTLQATPEKSALALSQILTFDRIQVNPVEDRASKVRNTVGWTVQLETERTGSASNSLDAKKSSSNGTTNRALSKATMAAAWQVNRAVALKAVLHPQDSNLDMALILKRWRQPRVTCSLLARHSWSTNTTRFLGLSVELETGAHTTSTNNDAGEGVHYPDDGSGATTRPRYSTSAFPTPQTKVVPATSD